MTYTDQVITCTDCGIDFVFSASEQEFFAEKGFASAPKRCASCRAQRRASGGGGGGGASSYGNGGGYSSGGGGYDRGPREMRLIGNAGVIGLLASILVWVSSYTAYL